MAAIIRTVLATLILAGVVLLIFWQISTDHQRRALEELETLNKELEQHLEQRKAMVERLGRSRRLAHLEIVEQRTNEHGEVKETDVLFVELNDDGREIGRQNITIPGNVMFVDGWTVKFDHELVGKGHPLRGRTLVLFRRIFSDSVAPRDGVALDTPGSIPPGYAASDMSRFEKKLWDQFWDIATDAKLAQEMGVRIAQGEAVYKPVTKGERYMLIVDAVGGMNLMPVERDDDVQVSGMYEHSAR